MTLANFGGKKAEPFRKGKKRRAKVIAGKKAAFAQGKRYKDLAKAVASGDIDLDLAVLTVAKRKQMSPSAFVFPAQRRYPISDLNHARLALSMSSGKPEETKVRAAVYKRFPQLRKDK